ncbi:FxSxx-COOH system tetratricopeptide repeat protein [Kribbella koreensis]|uniref:FxSxx-COOH system tetratricopeptide repeat protein n=1 Tax=Kribbella koreensis TaxID=57909 RepID=A0ABN1QPE7_9ACTN
MNSESVPDNEAVESNLDFYISYAGQDRLWAEWVGTTLMEAGYTIELDVWSWLPGDNVILAREAALRRAKRVVALCSNRYFGGGFTEQEWTAVMAAAGRGQGGRLIPVWIEDLQVGQLPDLLQSVQPIKLFQIAEPEAKDRILNALAGKVGPSGNSDFPGSAARYQRSQTGARLPGTHPRPAVWRVPLRNPDFTGRDDLLVSVREALLRGSPGVAILQGPGGVGKTQLSIEYAQRFAADYDTVWTIAAEQPDLITAQLAELGVDIGAANAVADAQTAASAALSALRDRQRWLLIFDNVEDPDHLLPFLPAGQGHTIATTRLGHWQEIGHVTAVEEFSRSESKAMLTSKVTGLQDADADAVAAALGDLPLALAQAVGVLQAGLPATEFLRLLDGQATKLLSQGKPRSYPASLGASTILALEKLSASHPAAAELLHLCGYLAPEPVPAVWFGRPFTRSENAPPLPTDIFEATHAFNQIRDLGLARLDQNGLRVHRLTQAILRDHTLQNQTAYLQAVIALLSTQTPPDNTSPATWPQWSQLVPHLLATDLAAAEDRLRSMACAAAHYLLLSGQTDAALTLTTTLHSSWTRNLSPNAPDTLMMAQFLAHAIFDKGDYALAAKHQRETLARRRETLGYDHPDTLNSANDLGVSISAMALMGEATLLNQDTYERRRRILGDDHPDTLTTASNLASTYREEGRRDEALALNQDTYGRLRRQLGEDHPHALHSANNLASTYDDAGRRDEALALHEDTYERRRRVLGDDHPDTLTSANNLGGMYHDMGRRDEAKVLHEDTYERRRRVLGDDHPDTLTSANIRAMILHNLKRRKEALELLEDTYRRRRRVLGDDHPDTIRSSHNLATAYTALGLHRLARRVASSKKTGESKSPKQKKRKGR